MRRGGGTTEAGPWFASGVNRTTIPIITSVTDLLAATTRHLPELKVFFSVVLLLLIGSAIYIVRNRKKFFGHTEDPGDTRASANLRMWMIVLILIHAIIVTTIMIFEV